MPPSDRAALAAVLLLPMLPLLTAPAGAAPVPVQDQIEAAGRSGPVFEVTPATSEIRVDAVLDEPAWAAAASVPITHEWFPGDNTSPPVATECLVTFDEEHLYVAFRAADPEPERVRAHLAERDTPFEDDTVGFLIDTFNDRRRAFQFRINPLGVQMDALTSDVDGSEDWSWDVIWDSAGRITADGYVVEVAVPLTQLRFPRGGAGPASGGVQTWGFLAMRDYPRTVRHRLRSTANVRDLNCFVCQSHPLTGFREIAPGRNLELDPTLTFTRSDRREDFPDGPVVSGDEEAEAGLSASWGPPPSVTLNAALNPDFSQVEADAAQLDVNETFALFFPERRPFFLEGTDYFATPFPVVFTRTIADPSFGLKLTGKEGPHVFGALVAEDRINNLIFPGFDGSSQASLDREVRTGVLRYRRDVGETSTLGLLYTGRDGSGYTNQVLGLDGTLRPTEADVVRFQALGSRTEYPDSVAEAAGQPVGSFDGDAYGISYSHSTRDWYWGADFKELDRDLRADAGFLPQVGFRAGSVGVERTFWGEEDDWYRRFEVFLGADRTEDHTGDVEDWGGDLVLTYQGPWQSEVSVAFAPNDESFEGVSYDNLRQSVFLAVRPTGSFAGSLSVRWGETIDFANSRQADFVTVAPEIELQLGRRFRGEASYVWQEIDVVPGRLLTAGVAEARLFYHFNRQLFLRAIVQHREVDRNAGLYLSTVEPEIEELLTQLLFSYELNPRTVVLAGYSDGRLGLQDVDLTQTGRTFFLKLGYALLL